MRHALEAPTPDHPERSRGIPLRKLKGVWRDPSTCARDEVNLNLIDLSFDQGRRLVFRYSGVDARAQFAVTHAVKEINQHTNSEPNKEADPRLQRQAQHQHEAKHDPQNWKNRTHRNAERAWPIRVGAPQDDDAEANENEGEERSDICKVSQRTDIDYGGDAADKNARPNGGDVWGPKSRMNAGKVLREQAITRHRHKNARLAQLEDK